MKTGELSKFELPSKQPVGDNWQTRVYYAVSLEYTRSSAGGWERYDWVESGARL